jgi:hypothetical protein
MRINAKKRVVIVGSKMYIENKPGRSALRARSVGLIKIESAMNTG